MTIFRKRSKNIVVLKYQIYWSQNYVSLPILDSYLVKLTLHQSRSNDTKEIRKSISKLCFECGTLLTLNEVEYPQINSVWFVTRWINWCSTDWVYCEIKTAQQLNWKSNKKPEVRIRDRKLRHKEFTWCFEVTVGIFVIFDWKPVFVSKFCLLCLFTNKDILPERN